MLASVPQTAFCHFIERVYSNYNLTTTVYLLHCTTLRLACSPTTVRAEIFVKSIKNQTKYRAAVDSSLWDYMSCTHNLTLATCLELLTSAPRLVGSSSARSSSLLRIVPAIWANISLQSFPMCFAFSMALGVVGMETPDSVQKENKRLCTAVLER